MYSLDVNFLRDRAPQKETGGGKKPRPPIKMGDLTPLYIGGAIAVFSLVLVGTSWFILQGQNSKLEGEIAVLDQENKKLEAEIGSINKIRQEISQVRSETQALVTVFDQIRPWSAMLQDVKERIPATTQLENVKQIAAPAPAAASTSTPGQSLPSSNGAIEVGGFARSFNDVNDFLLTLQQSRFFKPTETRITTADLVDATLPGVTLPPGVKLPKVVKYTIQSSLSDVPASELMRELEQKGTIGLVARIRSLQQTGALQK
jgi:type IV pilus assembly protein PilN